MEDINIIAIFKESFTRSLPIDPLPELIPRSENVPHAPVRRPGLSEQEKIQAVRNALRYFPSHLH